MRNRGAVLAAGAIVLFLATAAISLIWMSDIQRELHDELGESNLWAANQAEREGLRFLLALSGAETGAATQDDLALQFEIYFSRIALLTENPQRAFLEGIGQGEAIDHAATLIDAVEGALDYGALQEAAALTDELSGLMREVALATYMSERRQGIGLRERQIRATNLLRLSGLGVIVAGLLLAFLLIRDKRRLVRVQERLRDHQLSLEQTIAERTLKLRDALETEQRAKEVYRSFVIMVAHQFRTSISIIHLTAQRQVRSRDAAMSAPMRQRFARILDAAQRLERLIESFLETPVVDQRAFEGNRTTVDFNSVVSVAVRQTRAAHLERILRCDCTCQPLQVHGDAVLLEQVMLNIMSNAMKYSDTGNPVHVSTAVEGEMVRCTICDTGCGIPRDAMGSIFEDYYRAPNAQRVPGVGLGLSLAAQIVKLHGGTIDVTSELGKGSCFSILLPQTKGEAHERQDVGDDPVRGRRESVAG